LNFLALVMRMTFFSILAIVVISCSDKKENDPVFSRPDYAATTDSINANPNDPELYYHRGILLYENQERKYAEQDLRQAWKLSQKESYALSLATILREKSEDDAITFLEQAAVRLPESIAVRIGLARGYQKKKEYDKALSICNNIISIFPGQLDALLLKAEILDEQNKSAEALQTMATAYSYAPSDLELVHNYAFALAEAKDPRTLALMDSLLRMDSSGTHAEPYYFKGLYYENTGATAQALKLFDEAIRHDYYFIDAYMEKGEVLFDQKNYPQALKTFQLAVTISPTYAPGYYWVGKCLEAMGNKVDAKTNYQRAFGLDKTITEARDAAARL
jgi:tetratricopeptide (TPR) repeat protein